MSRLAIVVALVFPLGLSATMTSAQQANTSKPPPLPKNDAGGVPYWGVVTALGKDSITLRFDDDEPQRFTVSDVLAAGEFSMEARPIPGRKQPYLVPATLMYRLTDVKVGDWVAIKYSFIGGVITCDHVCIQKRPGGLVPPLPAKAEALLKPSPLPPEAKPSPYIPYHEYWNAYWDLEDRGIPYPEKFGRKRRFPVAPEPREVKLGPAIAP